MPRSDDVGFYDLLVFQIQIAFRPHVQIRVLVEDAQKDLDVGGRAFGQAFGQAPIRLKKGERGGMKKGTIEA